MAINEEEMGKLPPEERIKKLNELKKEKKEELDKADSLILIAEEEIRKNKELQEIPIQEEQPADISQVIPPSEEGLESSVGTEQPESEEKKYYAAPPHYEQQQPPEQQEQPLVLENPEQYSHQQYGDNPAVPEQPQQVTAQDKEITDEKEPYLEEPKRQESGMMRKPEEIQELVKTRDVFDITDFSIMKKDLVKQVKEYVPQYHNKQV